METDGRSQRQLPDVHRIEISVDWPPGHVAATLIDSQEPILVDAGMVGEDATEELKAGLDEVGHTLSDIDHLLITHPHVDHLGQIPALLDAADPTIYAPVGIRERLRQDTADLEARIRKNGRTAGLTGSMLEMAIEKSVESLERNRALLEPAAVDHWLEDETVVEIGDREFRTIHTPGHQADHFCYRAEVDGVSVLFSGDLLLAPFRSVVLHTGLDDGAQAGVTAFYAALERLDGVDVDRVYPGHGPAHSQPGAKIERSRQSLGRMLDHTRGLVTEGAETAIEVALERSRDREIQYVVPEVVGALGYLEDADEVSVTVEDGVKKYRADRE